MTQTGREQLPETCGWREAEDDDVCRRDATEDGFCIVHSPTQNQDAERFCRCIKDEHPLRGLKSTQLDLENKTIELDDNGAIDISDADIRTLCLDGAVITNEIKIENARVERLSAENAVFERGISFQDVECNEFVADGATIGSTLRVNGTEIKQEISIENAEIERLEGNSETTVGDLRLSGSTISGELVLNQVTVEGRAYLDRTNLGERCSLIGSTFKSGIVLNHSVVDGRFQMYESAVQEEAVFKNVEFNSGRANFVDGSFGKVIFDSVSSDDEIVFGTTKENSKREPAEINGDAIFTGANVEELNLEGVAIFGDLKMSELAAAKLNLSRSSCDGNVNLHRSSVGRELSFQKTRMDSLDLRDSHFRGTVDFTNSVVKNELSSEGTVYVEDVAWEGGEISEKANFDQAVFKSSVDFTGAKFEQFTDFCGARFEEVTVFDDTNFKSGVRFDRQDTENIAPPATFGSDVSFVNAEFNGVIFSGCSFEGDLNLDEAQFKETVGKLQKEREVAEEVSKSGGGSNETPGPPENYGYNGRSVSVSFHNADFVGNLSLGSVEISEELDLTLVTVEGDVAVDGPIGGLRLKRARFDGTFNLSEVEVNGPVHSEYATYHGDVSWEQGYVNGHSDFSRCRFESETKFDERAFRDFVTFAGVRFSGVTQFNETKFAQGAHFDRLNSSTEGEDETAPAPPATFESDVYFTNATFCGINFANCSFQSRSSFNDATFKKEGAQDESSECITNNVATVNPRVTSDKYRHENARSTPEDKIVATFRNAEFDGFASFESVELHGCITFNTASFTNVSISPNACPSESDTATKKVQAVSLRQSRIAEGDLWVLDGEGQSLELDLTEARLSDVTIHPRGEVDNVLDNCRIDRTEFDGFNFTPYASSLRGRRWTIHTTGEEIPKMGLLRRKRYALGLALRDYVSIFRDARDADEYQRLRTTYQYAKQGASHSGQNEAASNFFQREMEYQSRQLACEGNIFKLLSISGFGFTSRYGESGMRVGFVALLIVAIYTPIYRILPDVGNTWGESVTLSFGAFSTILVGTTDETVSSITNFAAATQGFVGALLIALLLFTLTRSIHR